LKCTLRKYTELNRTPGWFNLQVFLAILALNLVFFGSCRDSQENLFPIVSIQSPYDGELFSPGDSINVSASISDDDLIVRVLIQLVNSNYIPCGKAVEMNVGLKDHQLNTIYIIPDDVPWSEHYYLLIRAWDKHDYKNKYRRILISPKPESYLGLLMVCQESPSSKAIYLLDTLLNIKKISSFPGDSGSAAIWPAQGLLSTAGRVLGNLITLKVSDSTLAWSIPIVPNPPHPFFHEIATYNGMLFVCMEEGFVAAYNSSGTKAMQTPSNSSHYPSSLSFDASHVNIFWKDRNNAGGYIGRHYLSSGHQQEAISVSFQVLKMLGDDDGTIRLFYQEAGQVMGKQIVNGSLQNWINLPQGSFKDALLLGQGRLLLSLSSGCYLIDSSGQYISQLNASKAGRLAIDKSRQILYSVSGNHLTIKNLNTGVEQSITLPAPAHALFTWYQQ
jgi:hypothetical protein